MAKAETVVRGIKRCKTRDGGEFWAHLGFCGTDRLQFILDEAKRLGMRPTLIMRLLLHDAIDARLKAEK